MRKCLILAVTLALGGCDMAPRYIRPAAPVPAAWPRGEAYAPPEAQAPGMTWRAMAGDQHLQQVIALALAQNRELAASVATMAEARAQLGVVRAAQLPSITAGADADIARAIGAHGTHSNAYVASLGFSAYELDLFGRLKNQTNAAFETWLASAEGTRAARLALVAQVATTYATLAADTDLLALDRRIVESDEHSLALTQSLLRAGLASDGDVQALLAQLHGARADVEATITAQAQDRNALDLAVGGTVPDALLPPGLGALDRAVAIAPAGLSSQALLARPDVAQAEHALKASGANIGVVRAALFPTISLTAALGETSTAFTRLMSGGLAEGNVAPAASLPVFGGSGRASLRYAHAAQDLALASYQQAVQSAFADVANALARRGTIARQRASLAGQVAAQDRAVALYQAQYAAGTVTLADVLLAQRTLYAAQQSELAARLEDVTNRVALYAALGADPSLPSGNTP